MQAKYVQSKSKIYAAMRAAAARAPLAGGQIQAGFPSPAENYLEEPLDLNRYCVKNPPATFFVRVDGDSMTGAGICRGDLLVVDRSLRPGNNDIVVAVVDGEFTLKRLRLAAGRAMLCPENPDFHPIEVGEGMEFEVWGKVVKVIHEL